jgi:hypothetical protein
VVLGLWLQTAEDTVIAAVDEHAGHMFERRLHVGDLANSTVVFNYPMDRD